MLVSTTLFSSVYLFTYLLFAPRPTLALHPVGKTTICKLAAVHSDPAHCPYRLSHPASSLPTSACVWRVLVTSHINPLPHSLSLPKQALLKPAQLQLLSRLEGCNSTRQCDDQQIPCVYGLEDPSDVLWLRQYNNGIKFVIMMKIAFVTLVFYITAILMDGTLFTPHRASIAATTATSLIMIALSSLLYITTVPRRMQFVLFGAGTLQTAAFLLIVLTSAFVLPGIAIITLNLTVFVVTFIGFLLDLMLTLVIGVFHFFRGLALYHAQHTYLCLCQIYSNLGEDDYDTQLLAYSEKLLRHVRSNWNLHRVPRSLLDSADHAVRTVLPEHLHDQVPFAPFTTMESLDSDHDDDEDADSEHQQTPPTETTALLERTSGS